MPWTFSHPAVVLPIKHSRLGRSLNLLALVIGSLSPDLFYSLGLYGLATKAHHFMGWFYTGLPLSILIYLIFLCLKRSINTISPIPIIIPEQWNANQIGILIFSLFLGAMTHIIWDGFTHETGRFVRYITFLQEPLFPAMSDGQEIKIYKLLQYVSSLLGVLYLIVKYRHYQLQLSRNKQQRNRNKLYILFIMAIMSSLIVFPFSFYLSKGMAHLNQFIFYELTFSLPVMFVIIVFYILWRNKNI